MHRAALLFARVFARWPLGVLAAAAPLTAAAQAAVAVAQTGYVYAAPDPNAQVIGAVQPGDVLTLTACLSTQDWCQATENGDAGWVPTSLLDPNSAVLWSDQVPNQPSAIDPDAQVIIIPPSQYIAPFAVVGGWWGNAYWFGHRHGRDRDHDRRDGDRDGRHPPFNHSDVQPLRPMPTIGTSAPYALRPTGPVITTPRTLPSEPAPNPPREWGAPTPREHEPFVERPTAPADTPVERAPVERSAPPTRSAPSAHPASAAQPQQH